MIEWSVWHLTKIYMAATEEVPHKIQCFVLFDTETTGLPSVGNNPRITELCFLALTRDELEIKNATVRAVNKLCLCFNPKKRISPASIGITGLHNDSLEQLAPFKIQASMVCQFLQNLPQPTCVVAHNGNSFDFPLLVAELKASLQKVPDVLCADSLEAFRSFDGLPPVPHFVQKKSNKEVEVMMKPVSTINLESGNCEKWGDLWKHNEEQEAEKQDLWEYKASPCRKRALEDYEKLMDETISNKDGINSSYVGDFSERTVAYWDVKDLSTPSKKAQRVEPTVPIKRANPPSPTTTQAGTGPRQNLFGTCSGICESDESHRKLVYSRKDTKCDAESKLCGACEPTSSTQTNFDSKYRMELFPQKEKYLETENASQPGNLSSFSSLSDDSEIENLLLEAVEHAEKFHSVSMADVKKVMLPSKQPKDEYSGAVTTNHRQGNADKVGIGPKVSYSLPKIYFRVFGQEPHVSHTAEDDCRTMLQIIRGAAINKFPKWCDQNAVSLRSISPMY